MFGMKIVRVFEINWLKWYAGRPVGGGSGRVVRQFCEEFRDLLSVEWWPRGCGVMSVIGADFFPLENCGFWDVWCGVFFNIPFWTDCFQKSELLQTLQQKYILATNLLQKLHKMQQNIYEKFWITQSVLNHLNPWSQITQLMLVSLVDSHILTIG